MGQTQPPPTELYDIRFAHLPQRVSFPSAELILWRVYFSSLGAKFRKFRRIVRKTLPKTTRGLYGIAMRGVWNFGMN